MLRNFYIGLTLHHRQLLDFAAKGNFIELDANVDDFHKHMVELQKYNEPLKHLNGSINRMNTLITLFNKRWIFWI